eukprot:jgi/Picre1/30109/NNA_005478.t1
MFDTAFQKAHACVLDIYQAAPPKYSFPDGTGMGHHVFELQSRDKRNDTSAIYTNPTAGARLVEFGTTASVVILEPGFVAVGHVGDSDVILGSLDGQFLVATELTKPHSGHNISERYRIGEFLCEDEELLGLAALREDGYLEVSNLGGLSSVALGMTRAVGHYHLQAFGVIPSPEISFYDIDDGKDVCPHPRHGRSMGCHASQRCGRLCLQFACLQAFFTRSRITGRHGLVQSVCRDANKSSRSSR